MKRLADQTGAGCAERMAERDRAAVDVQATEINLANGSACAELLFCPFFRLDGANGSEHLSGKGFVNFQQIHLIPSEARALQGFRDSVSGRNEERLFANIDAGCSVSAEHAQGLKPEFFCARFFHHQHG